MIADGAINVHQMFNSKVGGCDEYSVKAHDDQRADGYIGDG